MAPAAEPFVPDVYFAPVPDEITAHDLPVTGTLPPELTGVYLRNGPNPRPGSPPRHPVAGDGMVHGVRIEGGRAKWYRNRYVKTDRNAGFRGGRSSNTHVFGHAGRIFSFVEVALPVELDPELETLGPVDFGGVETAFTAHGKVDPVTRDLVGFGYQFDRPHLTFYRVGSDGRLAERRVIDVAAACFMHDFGLTENHAVFFDTPALMVQDWGGAGLPFRWQDGRGTRIGVVPLRGGEPRWFDVPACQLLHTANAFEQDDRVVVDGIRMAHFPPHGPGDATTLHRWEIDLARGTVTEGALGRQVVELPRADERRTGRPYRFAYVVEFRDFSPGGMPRGSLLRRYDVESGTSVAHDAGSRYAPGEPVFVPRSAAGGETDGWVLAFRYDRERDGSDLVVLDANDFTGEPVAVVQLPRPVPFGFHGSWVAG